MTNRSLNKVVCTLIWEILSGRQKVKTPAQTNIRNQRKIPVKGMRLVPVSIEGVPRRRGVDDQLPLIRVAAISADPKHRPVVGGRDEGIVGGHRRPEKAFETTGRPFIINEEVLGGFEEGQLDDCVVGQSLERVPECSRRGVRKFVHSCVRADLLLRGGKAV